MRKKLSVSLIITTYNWHPALEITLKSVLGQALRPEQIIVADDGSGPETAGVVRKVLKDSGLSWCHVWHPDRGVRQSRIKNLAIKHSDHPYLIFIDQDVVIHPQFVADHLAMVREGTFLQGKRSLLPMYYTDRILSDGVFRPPSPLLRGLGNRKNTLHLSALGRILSRLKRFESSLRGCNLSMFRSDFIEVNGFDETFDRSWGREDSDICYRLFHAGLRVRNLWFLALQYHMKHKVATTWDRERLDGEIRRNIEDKRVRALRGFSQLSSEGDVIAASNER